MGYEIRGQKPAHEDAACFYAAIIEWPMIAEVLFKFAPQECAPCQHWVGEFCYGQGLNADQCAMLAARLRTHLADESIGDYIGAHFQGVETEWLSIGTMRDFVYFLETCGGFRIL